MAELPDLEVFSRNLHKIFVNKKLVKIKIVEGKNLKDSAAKLSTLKSKTLLNLFRDGKELRFQFSDGHLLGMHLMLTGDIFIFEKKNQHPFTIIEFYFEDDIGLALCDRLKNANVKLNPINKSGVDAISKELSFTYLKKALQRKTTIKNILMDQDVIRGIGNSYSDEILWKTGISPFSVAAAIPELKIKELVKNIKSILKNATNNIYKNFPEKVNVEVKEYLKIHTKSSTHSPTGAEIKIESKGMRKTYYTDEQILYK